jgi:hypothetical protein
MYCKDGKKGKMCRLMWFNTTLIRMKRGINYYMYMYFVYFVSPLVGCTMLVRVVCYGCDQSIISCITAKNFIATIVLQYPIAKIGLYYGVVQL